MNDVMTERAHLILSEIGDFGGVQIDHFSQLVERSVFPSWRRELESRPLGTTRDSMIEPFVRVLQDGGLGRLLEPDTVFHLMPDEREWLESLELWNWFMQLGSLRIHVLGEGEYA